MHSPVLETIHRRRAIRAFVPAKIAPELRDQLLAAACAAPSSLNLQPYRIYYIDTPPVRAEVARLCMGQAAATTASALVVVVADIGSWKATHRARVARMRELGVDPDRIGRHERKMKVFGPLLFRPGWFSLLGYFKNAVFRLVNLWKVMGIPARSSSPGQREIQHWPAKT
jgi:nitroreductase